MEDKTVEKALKLNKVWQDTDDLLRVGKTYPPCDSNALRGDGFQLHLLRWSIGS